jgi:AbrB family looped-hinge helix DNA binding protein
MIMEAARQVVQKKHRIAIPKEYREALGIREGDEVELRLEGGRIIIKPKWIVDNPTERLSGLVKSEKPLPPEKLEEEIYRQRARRHQDDSLHRL